MRTHSTQQVARVVVGVLVAMLTILTGCETTPGTVITDTGKTRAMRERAERDARAQRESRPSGVSDSRDAGAASTDSEAGTAPSAGEVAVLLDVVRPGATLDDYEPVDDAELASVRVQRAGAIYPAQRGLVLAVGDEVITPPDRIAILNYGSDIEVYVMPQTQIRVGSIFVRLGEIWVSIKGKLKEKFKVETEFVTAGVEGTQFLFRAQPDGGVDVDVLQGSVLCTSKSARWAPIRMTKHERLVARANIAPQRTRLVGTDIARVNARIKPLDRAVATKVIPRAVKSGTIRLRESSQAPVMTKPPVVDTQIQRVPERSVPDSIITKPPVIETPLQRTPTRTLPQGVITKPTTGVTTEVLKPSTTVTPEIRTTVPRTGTVLQRPKLEEIIK